MAKQNMAPEEGPNGVDRWTSNGYGVRIDGKLIRPAEPAEKEDEIDEIEEVE